MDNIGKIEPREITQEMQESYLSYAMSVIISRALPDVRDGLKPVHRRILYAMHEIGLRPEAHTRKSAAVVGEVLGKYHPHGDVAVYDTLVRMAQDFSLRYPLIYGQGNFGSMDGDSAAAMRYTETKLAPIAREMLNDIEKNTVDFIPNYDDTKKEPVVLPARLPNLLLNGTMGIAVGMATNIPPHNLNELADSIVHLINHPEATIEDLLQFVKGPDFPTGGIIYDQKQITQVYATGKGPIVIRAKTDITEKKKGQFQIIVNEVPYQVNKATLLEKIAELARDKKIEGIRDLRDESDKDGVRIVVELKNDSYPQKVLNKLFQSTDLQKTFHVNMLALCDGIQPKVLSLKNSLEYYIGHQQEVVTRRTQFDLTQAKDRAHILAGLKKALDHIDSIISAIKKSSTKEEAHGNLMKKFDLSDKQTTAILEMKLQTLAGLERQKIEDELKEKLKLIKELETLLKDSKKILEVIKNEVLILKDKYGDERRTKVVKGKIGEFSEEDLIADDETIVVLTGEGYIKRVNPSEYKVQKRGGKGIIGMATRDDDIINQFITTTTHANLLFFTDKGRVFQLKAYELPSVSRTHKGQAMVNFIQVQPNEKVNALIAIKSKESGFLTMCTKNGLIKKTALEEFENVRRSGLIAITLKNDDQLKWVKITSGKDELILATSNGQAIRFKENNVRPMGRTAAGVTGIKLAKGDEVKGMDVVVEKFNLLIVTENGFGKVSGLKQYKTQSRGGKGIKTAKITAKTGKIVSSKVVGDGQEDLIAISQQGQVIRTPLQTVPSHGRATQGVKIMKMEAGDKVASITCV